MLITLLPLLLAAGLALAVSSAAPPTLSATAVLSCVNSKPAHFSCPVRGRLSKPNVIGQVTGLSSLQRCRDICLTHGNCITFSWTQSTGQCVQYGKNLPQMGLTKDRTQAAVLYNRHCFSCAGAASPKTTAPSSSPGVSTVPEPQTLPIAISEDSSASKDLSSGVSFATASDEAPTTSSDASLTTSGDASLTTSSDASLTTSSDIASTTSSDLSSSTTAATPCQYTGLEYAIYANPFPQNTDATYSAFDPVWFKTRSPEDTGDTTTIGGFDSGPNPMTVYGGMYTFSNTFFVLNHRGYIYVPVDGTYTVNTGLNGSAIDDIVCFWTGTDALRDFARENAAVCASFNTGYGITSTTFTAQAGYVPFRALFGQASGGTGLTMNITDPSGNVILATNFETTDLGNFIVHPRCAMTTSATAFPAWGLA